MGVDARMLVKTSETITDDELRALAVRLKDCFGEAIWRSFEWERPGLIRKKPSKAGETRIEVDLWGRYYGPGYERGNLPEIIMIAEWLEAAISGAKIYYGGDCDMRLTRFGKKQRAALFAHFVANGHTPYHGGFGHGKGVTCAFCLVPMSEHMWGGGRTGYACHGCDLHVLRDNGTGVVSYCDKSWESKELPPSRKLVV